MISLGSDKRTEEMQLEVKTMNLLLQDREVKDVYSWDEVPVVVAKRAWFLRPVRLACLMQQRKENGMQTQQCIQPPSVMVVLLI